jgi:hypothetical protein
MSVGLLLRSQKVTFEATSISTPVGTLINFASICNPTLQNEMYKDNSTHGVMLWYRVCTNLDVISG